MSSRYDRENERNYRGNAERDYRGGNSRPFQYGAPARRGMPQPEYPDRVSGYDYAPDEDYGATYASGRNYGRGYGYARDRYGSDYGYERDISRDYGYGRDISRDYGYGREGAPTGYANRYGRSDDRARYYRDPRQAEHDERTWWDRTKDELASWFGDEEAERRRRLDELRAAPFRGRGPRGYRRSDDRIKEDIHDRLTDHPYLDAYEIVVTVAEGDVTLSGTVGTRYEKRLAEDLAATVSGVHNVQNNLRATESTRTATNTGTPEMNTPAVRSAAGGTK